jgi:tRNA pseudouridine32 synthase/23S rRNA pseudouridine746 synthase
MYHAFQSSIDGVSLPAKFTCPFFYTPHPLCAFAADEVCEYLETQSQWAEELKEGKMFGVLAVRAANGEVGYLAAFSGNIAHCNRHEFFVPPVYDLLNGEGYFVAEEKRISAINEQIEDIRNSSGYAELKALIAEEKRLAEQEIENTRTAFRLAKTERDRRRGLTADKDILDGMTRESRFQKAELKRMERRAEERVDSLCRQLAVYEDKVNVLKEERRTRSFALQRKLFDSFRVLNASGEEKSLYDIFRQTAGKLPPAGAGECAAPKLLQYAYKSHLHPVAMAEFWWKKMPGGETGQERLPHPVLTENASLRRHGSFYPACRSKCEPVLAFMMQGLDVEDNPLLEKDRCCDALETVFEDEWLAVVNKPACMLSVPGKTGRESVYSRMRERYPDATGPLVVHRLDMDTSGLMVIAKTESVYKELQKMFTSRTIEKCYVAMLDGIVADDAGEIALPLCLDPDDRPRQAVSYEYGKPSVTGYKVLKRTGRHTFIAFYPLTGRTHQLRVHSAHPGGLNAPIKGDRLYGTPSDRLHLHAQSLKFTHPVTNEKLSISTDCDFMPHTAPAFMNIRNAKAEDIECINDIHNQAIREKFKVAYSVPWTKERCFEWFKEHNRKEYPVYVAEIDNTVVGFVYINPYRPGRIALKQTAEISYFVDKGYRGKGTGKVLIEYMESKCHKLGIKTLFAVIIDKNEASIKLIEKCGYKKWGHLPGIAVFDNTEAGHLYYGKRIISGEE